LKEERVIESSEISPTGLPKWKIGTYEYTFHGAFLQILFERFYKAEYLVLDGGCGEGQFLEKLREDVCVVGMDIERENIKEAKKRYKGHLFVVGDLQHLPFKIQAFHLIFCRDVLEHITKRGKAISEMTFALRKKGVILISTTNLLNPAMLLDTLLPTKVSAKIIKKFKGPEYYERTSRFSPWEITKKLRENGLDVKIIMFGFPSIGKPWHARIDPPMIYRLWTVFDKITNFNLFRKFKEVIVAIARK